MLPQGHATTFSRIFHICLSLDLYLQCCCCVFEISLRTNCVVAHNYTTSLVFSERVTADLRRRSVRKLQYRLLLPLLCSVLDFRWEIGMEPHSCLNCHDLISRLILDQLIVHNISHTDIVESLCISNQSANSLNVNASYLVSHVIHLTAGNDVDLCSVDRLLSTKLDTSSRTQ